MSNICRHCKRSNNEKTPEGVCRVEFHSDGAPYRCSGNWVTKKLKCFQCILHMVSTALKNKWPDLFYIDLFAGPGINRVRETGEFIEGGPLIGVKSRDPFSKCIFVEKSNEAYEALLQRVNKYGNVLLFRGDCNDASIINEIRKNVPEGSVSICLIDPTSIDIKFNTIKTLTERRNIDLVINFPFGMAINRILPKYFNNENENDMDSYFGGTEWRGVYGSISSDNLSEKGKRLLILYKEKLANTGYKFIDSGISIKAPKKNIALYNLFFASKHERGLDFWNKVKRYAEGPQTKLFL